MLTGMAGTKRITITLPIAVAAAVQQRVEAGEADSVSGLVADVLTEHFQEENLERFLADWDAASGPVDEETKRDAEEWANAVWRSARGE
jgi:Arc/MetJ-type ribon-helix-helix transcriptional regulator